MQWADMSEKTWGRIFERYCKEAGWAYYHTHDSRHSAGGFPDYVVTNGVEIFYAELKTETGKLTAKQEHWRDLLIGAGQEWHLWRPSNEQDVIERLNGDGVPATGA